MARQDQVQALQRIGYRNVHAIGCPICYVTETRHMSRLSNSVVFMPAHALDGAPFENQQEINNYVEYIASYKNSFESLYVCLNMACIRNNQWWPQLLERGIRIIGGADYRDANSLSRIHRILSHFTFMSTSEMGSHVCYALATGCHVSIVGPKVSYSTSQLLQDFTFASTGKEFLAHYLTDNSVDTMNRAFIERFSKRPSEGIADMALGHWLIGSRNRMRPSDLRRLLGWKILSGMKTGAVGLPRTVLRRIMKQNEEVGLVSEETRH